jgi:hypothetical protein
MQSPAYSTSNTEINQLILDTPNAEMIYQMSQQ